MTLSTKTIILIVACKVDRKENSFATDNSDIRRSQVLFVYCVDLSL